MVETLLEVKTVAKEFGISTQAVYDLIHAEKLTANQLLGRCYLVRQDEKYNQLKAEYQQRKQEAK